MTVKEFLEEHKNIANFLVRNEISQAIDALQNILDKISVPELAYKLSEIKKTYSMLLHYFIKGMPDPKRNEMITRLVDDLYKLNDKLNYLTLSKVYPSDYFTHVRSQILKESSIEQLLAHCESTWKKILISQSSNVYSVKLHADYQEAVYAVFYKIWTTQFLDKNTADLIINKLTEEPINPSEEDRGVFQASLLAALYLGCMQYFDALKLKVLISVALNNSDSRILARAYTYIVLILGRYGERIRSNSALSSLLSLMADNESFHQIYLTVIHSFIRSVDTARINKTIVEDIIPDIMKSRPEIEKAFRGLELNSDSDEPEYNPEWEEILSKSGLDEKFRRLNELQMDGGDMFMMAFAQMKSTPFFRNPVNWLIPFSLEHTEVKDSSQFLPPAFGAMISRSGIFCDSDAYSLFIGLKRMPSATVSMMANQIQSQISHFEEEVKATFSLETRAPIETFIERFMKDLYRFYNQFVNANDFVNPFAQSIDFGTLPIIGETIDNLTDLEQIGNMYFKRNMWSMSVRMFTSAERYYEEAISTFNSKLYDIHVALDVAPEHELHHEPDIALLFERKGYALMRLKKYEEAKDAFLTAIYFKGLTAWLMGNCAECYRHLEDGPMYEKCLRKASELDPDNKKILLKLGKLLMHFEKFDDAVKILYKLIYLDEENMDYIRTLAWCRCLENEPTKALELYIRINESDIIPSDLLNMGHCYFASGDLVKAVECYRRYIVKSDKQKFIHSLNDDIRVLSFLKSKQKELALVRDDALLN